MDRFQDHGCVVRVTRLWDLHGCQLAAIHVVPGKPLAVLAKQSAPMVSHLREVLRNLHSLDRPCPQVDDTASPDGHLSLMRPSWVLMISIQ